MSTSYYIGVDIGGTFTDVFVSDGDSYWEGKSPTTPGKLHEGLLDALGVVAEEMDIDRSALLETTHILTHGSTIITNILAEMRGAKTGFITTRGFRDLLNIGRSPRTNDMDFYTQVDRPEIVARNCIAEVTERIDYAGRVVVPLDLNETREKIRDLVEVKKCDAIAVCCLFSFKNDCHETQIKDVIEELYPEVYISISSEVNPVFREYERMVTTILNAYSGKGFSAYIGELETRLENQGFEGRLLVTQSNGGSLSAGEARIKPVTLAVSGPAGGIVSSSYLGKTIGEKNLLTADMGGTSFDVSVIYNEEPITVSRAQIGPFQTNLPILDITTVGAGGGSIAWIDNRGMMRVGPQSAGASPGPVCYGQGGTEPTVTDAVVVLGLIDPDFFLGGAIKLDKSASERAISEKLAGPMGLETEAAAVGVYRTISANMGNALRNVTIEKGYDPREFALVSYGGCSPLFIATISKELNIRSIVIPETCAVFSAFGACMADVKRYISLTFYHSLPAPIDEVNTVFRELAGQAADLVESDGIARKNIELIFELDMRIHGQIWEIPVTCRTFPLDLDAGNDAIYLAFKTEYGRKYGEAMVGDMEQCDILNLRVVAHGIKPKPAMLAFECADGADPRAAVKGRRRVFLPETGELQEIDVIDGAKLRAGMSFAGPVLIERKNTTIYVIPGSEVEIDRYHNCLMRLH